MIERQKYLADAKGQSLNERIKGLIENDVQQVKLSFLDRVQKLQEASAEEYGFLPEGTVEQMIHEERK